MKFCINVVILLMALMIISCISNNIRNYHEFSFIPEIYPYTDTVYSNHFNETSFYKFGQQDKPKLLLCTNGDCSVCFAQISEWYKYLKDSKKLFEDVAIAIVIQTDNIHMLEYNLEKIDNFLPIYIDTTEALQIYNMIDYNSSTSLLLSQENYIIGEVAELDKYKRKIHKLFTVR